MKGPDSKRKKSAKKSRPESNSKDPSLAIELESLRKSREECRSKLLPYFLSYELLRESPAFARLYAQMAGENWCLMCKHWNLPKIKDPCTVYDLAKYIPVPWYDIPDFERNGLYHDDCPALIRGEDLLALIPKTCFKESNLVFSIKGELRGGNVDAMVWFKVPRLRYGVKYLLMEIDPMKSKNEHIRKFVRGLETFPSFTAPQITRADNVPDKLKELTAFKLHRAIGGFKKVCEYLSLNGLDAREWKELLLNERMFYRRARAGKMLVEKYDQAVKRCCKVIAGIGH